MSRAALPAALLLTSASLTACLGGSVRSATKNAVPVVVDETLTSAAAQSELTNARRSGYLRRRVQRESTDRVAACLIAEQWLSESR